MEAKEYHRKQHDYTFTQESRLSSSMGVRRVKSIDLRDPSRIKEGRDCFRHSFLSSC